MFGRVTTKAYYAWMTPDRKSSSSPAACGHQSGTEDVVLHLLKRYGIPVTRENYLDLAYPEGLPSPWGAELEAQLPKELQEAPELSEEEAWRKHRQRQRDWRPVAPPSRDSRKDHSR